MSEVIINESYYLITLDTQLKTALKSKPKQLLWQIKMDGDNPVNQSKLEIITRSRHKARENVHARVTIDFGKSLLIG